MQTTIVGVIALLVFTSALTAQEESRALAIGEVVRFPSAVLDEDRELNIYLPPSYGTDTLQRYPVIYLLDGSIDEDFIHIVGLVQFGSFPWIGMLPESIVVGIANRDRKRDFTYPSSNSLDREEFPTSGGSAPFIAFLREELQPLIAARYRTTPVRTLIGQSLGGLLATEVLLTQPGLFDHYIIVSPSLWWDEESLLDRDLALPASVRSVYVAVGQEGEVMERTARALSEKVALAQSTHLSGYFEFLAEQSHGDALHLAVYHAFEKIFSAE